MPFVFMPYCFLTFITFKIKSYTTMVYLKSLWTILSCTAAISRQLLALAFNAQLT